MIFIKTSKEIVQYFENLYKNKAIYVWGMNGEIINKEVIDKTYSIFKSSTYNRIYYDNKLKEGNGRIGADCSGCMCPVSGFDTTAQNYYNRESRIIERFHQSVTFVVKTTTDHIVIWR